MARQHVAGAAAEALGVFQGSQLVRGRDQDIGIAADGEDAACVQIAGRRKDPVAEIGLRDGAEPRHCATGGQGGGLRLHQVCRVDQAPATVSPRFVQQPFHRPAARPRQAVIHLPHLLGGMDVHRRLGRQPGHDRQLLRRHSAQGVRRDPDHRVRQACASLAGRLVQPRKAVGIVDESALARAGRGAAEAAVGIEHRQQGQADTRRRRRRGNAPRQFGRIGVRPPIRVMVQIVKLADPSEAGLQHLCEGQGGDRLHIVRPEPIDEAVHDLAPAPEVVVPPSPRLSEACHAALEGVAVDIRQAGQPDPGPLILSRRVDPDLDGADPPALAPKAHAVSPAVGQQGGFKPQGADHVALLIVERYRA